MTQEPPRDAGESAVDGVARSEERTSEPREARPSAPSEASDPRPEPPADSGALHLLQDLLDDVPPEELPQDPRVIARATLAASRNTSLWWVSAGIVIVVGLAVLVSARVGATALAGLLAAGAVVRAVAPAPGPVALVVRSRTLDVVILLLLAVGVGILAQLIPRA